MAVGDKCYRCSRDIDGRKQVMVQLDGATRPDLGKVVVCEGCAPKKKSMKRPGES